MKSRFTVTWRTWITRCAATAAALALWTPLHALAGFGAVGDLYMSESWLGNVYQFDGVTGDPVSTFAISPGSSTPLGHEWGPDGNLYVCTTFSLTHWRLLRYDGVTGQNLGPVLIHQSASEWSTAKAIAFGPDGDCYIGDFTKQRVDRYDGETFEHKAGYQGGAGTPLSTPNDMKFTSDGRLLVLAGGFRQIVEFDTSDDGVALVGVFAGPLPEAQPQSFDFGPGGDIYVANTASGGIFRVDGVTGDLLGWFIEPADCPKPSGIVFDLHGRLIVGNYETWDVHAYDAVTGEWLGVHIAYPSDDQSPFHMTIRPPRPSCPADLDGDGTVGSADLGILLGSWGQQGGFVDLSGSGFVGSDDLAILLGNWGPCPE